MLLHDTHSRFVQACISERHEIDDELGVLGTSFQPCCSIASVSIALLETSERP